MNCPFKAFFGRSTKIGISGQQLDPQLRRQTPGGGRHGSLSAELRPPLLRLHNIRCRPLHEQIHNLLTIVKTLLYLRNVQLTADKHR